MDTLTRMLALTVTSFALAGCGSSGNEGGTTTDIYDTTTPPVTTQTTAETESTPSIDEPTAVRIVVANGSPKSGIVRVTVQKGDRVVLVVESDAADEVHLHGYDITRDVPAGGTVRLRFKADVPGRFEVELENRGTQIADLTVEP